MARLTGPLMSLTASGTLGKAITFSRWKGIAYARTRVIPFNPQTDDQDEVRNAFTCLNEMWKRMPMATRYPFIYSIRGRPLTARNRHIQVNVPALQGETTLDKLVMSVATGQAVPPATANAIDGGGQTIQVTATAPTVPAGYTLGAIQCAAIEDVDPNEATAGFTFFAQKSAPSYIIDVDVLAAGEFQIATWCYFTRDSDGQNFYSAALRAQVTVNG